MRCIVGFVLFVVLYFGGLQVFGSIVMARALEEGYSQKAAKRAGAKAVSKYHAVWAVGSGILAIGACCVPTLLIRANERSEWRAYEEYDRV
jgi:hypothetical protein